MLSLQQFLSRLKNTFTTRKPLRRGITRPAKLEALEVRTMYTGGDFTNEGSLGMAGFAFGAATWGDYDNDGDLDALLSGHSSTGETKVYQNDGDGNFTDAQVGLPAATQGDAVWGDYDNDGHLDIALIGSYTAEIYRNDGQGGFSAINAGLTGVNDGSAAWGDYDNDGRLDLMIAGEEAGATKMTRVYRNEGNGVFTDIQAELTGISRGDVTWADYDSDGDLDLALMGQDVDGFPVMNIYQNDGNGLFTDINTDITEASLGSLAWGDYDNDGDLDLAINGIGPDQHTNITKIYRNDGNNTFTEVAAGLAGSQTSNLAWGDYDNDGNLDLLVTGANNNVYHNDGNDTFSDAIAGLGWGNWGAASWGDYDGDGDLDILQTSYHFMMGIYTTAYQNETVTPNTAPAAPTDLTILNQTASSLTFSWTAAVDEETLSEGLSYNIRVGTTPGGSDVMSAMANSLTGERTIAQAGKIQRTNYTLTGLSPGVNYYWSVQAIDPSLAGGAFAAEQSASLNATPVVTPETFSVNENSVNGTAVDTVAASDADLGQTLTYAITAGNTNNAFAIDASTGAITVNNAAALNYEVTQSYSLTVTATDNATPTATGSATITINVQNVNEKPVVTAKDFLIGENSPNTAYIGAITATDPDAGQTLTYFITAGNTNNAFAIDATTGVLTVNNSAVLNYETVQQFNLTVTATDNGNPVETGSAPVTIFLRDVNEAPVVTATEFLIGENSVNGAYIGVVPVADPDAGQTVTYSIVAGNTGDAFAIDPSTGVLTVHNRNMLDYETVQRFNLVVRVVDNGNPALSGSAAVTIHLRDTNDAPVVQAKQFLIGENSANGAFIGNVVATDQDVTQTKTYSIVAGNFKDAFAINPATGALTVNNTTALDYETTPRFDLTIRVVDDGTPALSGSAVVTVFLRNENDAPVVRGKDYLIAENSFNDAFIGTITATDQDYGQTRTFSITGGNTGNAFKIDPSTGVLSVNNSAALNYETTTQFNLTIAATDNGTPARTGTTPVTIFLRNVNEAPVMVARDFLVAENTPNNSFIGMIVASDQDVGQTKTFSIVGGNSNNAFSIEPTTGILRVNNSAALDYEARHWISLTIRVTDNGNPALSATAPFTVYLRDLDEKPLFRIEEKDITTVVVPTGKKSSSSAVKSVWT